MERGKPLSIEDALKIIEKVASALNYARKHGLGHREVEPEGALLSAESEPTVADFAIAPTAQVAREKLLTQPRPSAGPFCMISEPAASNRDIGSRSDVYAFASVPYEMPTGEPPYMGTSEARPDKSRTPARPVPFEYVTDEEEDHVGLDAEDVSQLAALTEAVKVRPWTFHQWLNGGRLVEELVQVSHADTIEDPMEW